MQLINEVDGFSICVLCNLPARGSVTLHLLPRCP